MQFVDFYVKNAAPSLRVYPIQSPEDAFPAIREGKCGAALLGKSEVELLIAGAFDRQTGDHSFCVALDGGGAIKHGGKGGGGEGTGTEPSVPADEGYA